MNTDISVEGTDFDLRGWFDRVEACLSRFRPESSLSSLNRYGGRWTVVPPLLFRAIFAALQAAQATDGAFDPTVLGALEAAGYSRSFELGPTPTAPPRPAGRWREVQLDAGLHAVWLPEGVRLDLGGIGKGLAVDGAMAKLKSCPRALVNAGGDLAARTAPGDPPILVDVVDPFDPDRTLVTFGLHGGAAATSSTLGRRWGEELHHIIDPGTGRPADSGVVAATVFAPTAVQAETLAKAAIVLGAERGLALLARRRCPGLLVTAQGQTILTPGLEEYRHVTA